MSISTQVNDVARFGASHYREADMDQAVGARHQGLVVVGLAGGSRDVVCGDR
ncbi:MAG: hypothetical protein PSX37_04380 [bacterium]|nr:hypothetical protein [bacterium]